VLKASNSNPPFLEGFKSRSKAIIRLALGPDAIGLLCGLTRNFSPMAVRAVQGFGIGSNTPLVGYRLRPVIQSKGCVAIPFSLRESLLVRYSGSWCFGSSWYKVLGVGVR